MCHEFNMTVVITEKDKEGEVRFVTTETEIAVMHLQTKKCQDFQ